LQRLFRNYDACRMIKKCNDFGAGGVSVAIGELADGLEIDLDKVPKKYEGLDGTELAISESQERMAVVVGKDDAEKFISLASKENLQAVAVAVVKDEPRLKMTWRGKTIVDVSREFLNSNGAKKHTAVVCKKAEKYEKQISGSFVENYRSLAGDLNICSKRGLSERFDSTIGAGTVLMPFGGKYQLTPIQAMAHKISVEKAHTDTCSVMAWGYNPFITEKSQYHGAYLAVIESVSKLIASGADFNDVYLTFQEYFEKPGAEPARWGKPAAALLGAFKAQTELQIASIGGKDSMSGSFEDLDVPPTLVSFAVTTEKCENIISPEFKKSSSRVYLLKTEYDENDLPKTDSLLKNFDMVSRLVRDKKALSVYTLTYGGIAEAVMKMCFGNMIGFRFEDGISLDTIFGYNYGSFVIEADEEIENSVLLGKTTDYKTIVYQDETAALDNLLSIYENKLESVYHCNIDQGKKKLETFSFADSCKKSSSIKSAKPKVFIPAFPGTNCEYDSAKAFEDAGAKAEIVVINNLTPEGIKRSIEKCVEVISSSQIIFIPGGFSGGDEPDGSGKFITAFFRNTQIKDAVSDLLDNRDGLMAGICNGFQALIKLGLVPYGKITDLDENSPTLTFNTIARHQSKIVRTRIASNKSPWLSQMSVGDVVCVPISHGEGRFLADEKLVRELASNGQIATQYVDFDNEATTDIQFNPNNSVLAVEGITSPDGRVFGKMGHSERIGNGLYKNVPGEYNIKMFDSAVKYFK
ncbi:MAG: phosphoribosylformylglycinamidine synthase, partial [Clostridia bacterium]|nr:phosphoribosylformylglycinamidine synthase [Clostridia bacterium]